MTIKIIKQGQVPSVKPIIYQCKCGHCKTVFQYQLEDTRKYTTNWYSNTDCDEEKVIDCPTCEGRIKHREVFRLL